MLAKRLDRAFLRYRDRDDGRALAEVFDLVADDLFRFATHLCKSVEQAEDLVQTTFLKAIERRASYEAEGKFFSWLAGILANEWKQQCRRAGRTLDAARLHRDAAPESSAVLEDEEVRRRVMEALAGVPEPYKGVLDLRYREDLKSSAIAARLRRPQGTVRAQLSRGLELLRRLLPASMLGLFVASLSPRLHAQVRTAVLHEAGFKPVAGLASLSLLKAAVVVSTAVVLFSLGSFFDEDAAPPLDDAGELPEVATSDLPIPGRFEGNRPEDDEIEDQKPVAVATDLEGLPGWRWHDPRPRSHERGQKSLDVGELRLAALPAGLSFSSFEAGPAGISIPPSVILDEAEFGPLERFPGDQGAWSLSPSGDRIAQVFFDDLRWGRLVILPLGRRDRSMSAMSQRLDRIDVASRFQIRLKDAEELSSPPVALLQGREGLVRRPFRNDDGGFVLDERAPLPLEVELPLKSGERLRVCMWKERMTTSLSSGHQAARQRRRLRPLALDGGGAVVVHELSYLLPSDPRLSFALEADAQGLYREPSVSWQRKNYARLRVSGPEIMTQLISLRHCRARDENGHHLVMFLPEFERAGLLVEQDGAVMVGASLSVSIDGPRSIFLRGHTDEDGRFKLATPALSDADSAHAIEDFDLPVVVEIQAADGRLARMKNVPLRSLFAGPRLVMPPGAPELVVELRDADDVPVPKAVVIMAAAQADDEVDDQRKDDLGVTDAEGRCRLHGLSSEFVDIVVQCKGRSAYQKRFPVPEDGHLLVQLPAVQEVRLQVSCPVTSLELGSLVRASYRETGDDRGNAMPGIVTFDEHGAGRFEAPLDARFEISLSPRPQGRDSDVALRVWPQKRTGVRSGDVLEIPVMVGRSRAIELEFEDGAERESAVVHVARDGAPDLSAWEMRTRGFGGSWGPRTPLTFPLGLADITVIAPGHRILQTRVVTTLEDAGELRYRLKRGPRVSGVLDPAGRSGPDVLAFELIEVSGVELSEKYIESIQVGWRPFCRVDAEGVFESPPLIPGRYRLSARGRDCGEIEVRDDTTGLRLERRD